MDSSTESGILVEVLVFAILREKLGVTRLERVVCPGTTVGQIVDQLFSEHQEISGFRPYVRVALNEAFIDDGEMQKVVQREDVIALIPPVSGGAARPLLTEEPIAAKRLVDDVYTNDCGAVVTFEGRVRNHTGAHQVISLDYEAYGAMAERKLNELLMEVRWSHPDVRVSLQHRLGALSLGEVAVAIAVASPHRKASFAACASLIDRLKEDVPIFKKEYREGGDIWVGLGP